MVKTNFLLLLFFSMLFQSFQCVRSPAVDCASRISDSAFLRVSTLTNSTTVKLFDTIWLRSTISDTVYNKTGMDNIVSNFNQLYLSAQPYSVQKVGSIAQLAFANIEFNPVVKDGFFGSSYYSGFQFQFRRNAPYNYLQAGFIAGKVGLYAFVLNHGTYGGAGSGFYISPSGDYCKQFFVNSSIASSQQNLNYWDTLQVSSLPLANSSGNAVINKSNSNYFLIKVVP